MLKNAFYSYQNFSAEMDILVTHCRHSKLNFKAIKYIIAQERKHLL